MCVIVDMNVASTVLLNPTDKTFAPVRDRLFGTKRPIRLVYGGQLVEEYSKNRALRRSLFKLKQAARVFQVNDGVVKIETKNLRNSGVCRSNDAHIIALARVSKARVLISLDDDLIRDFKNARLIDQPRGKIYKQPSHSRLLDQCEI